MTGSETMMILGGLGGVALLGLWHLGGLLALTWLKPAGGERHALAVLVTFWGLLLLHFSEIVLCAVMLHLALAMPGAGEISGGPGAGAAGLLYFAGINFTTLGLTDQTARGAIRLLIMLQSLGGFMLLTWSATFVYSVWEERYR